VEDFILVLSYSREAIEEPEDQKHPEILYKWRRDAHDAVHQQRSY